MSCGNYEVQCSVEDKRKFFKESQKCLENDGLDKSITLHRKQLQEFSEDVHFQLSLCALLYKKYKAERDEHIEEEIFELCEKINKSGKPDMQCGARRIDKCYAVISLRKRITDSRVVYWRKEA